MRSKPIPYEECHAILDGDLIKKCSVCEDWFPCDEDYYYKNKSSKDGFNPYCKECTKMKSYNWILNNPEKHKEHMKKEDAKKSSRERQNMWSEIRRENGAYKEWQQSESGKEAMKKSRIKREVKKHKITNEEINKLYEFCNKSCMYCGLTEIENQKLFGQVLTRDHAINLGSNGIENCVLCCKSCSSAKHNWDWNEWYTPENPRYSKILFDRLEQWLSK